MKKLEGPRVSNEIAPPSQPSNTFPCGPNCATFSQLKTMPIAHMISVSTCVLAPSNEISHGLSEDDLKPLASNDTIASCNVGLDPGLVIYVALQKQREPFA